MKKNLTAKLLLFMALMLTGQSNAWGQQVSEWTATNTTYTSGQQITGSVDGVVTMTLGTDNGWVYDTGRKALVTRTQQSPTLNENNIPTAGGYVVITPKKDINFEMTTYSTQNNCNLYMYDEQGNKLKDFRQKAYQTNDFGTLEAGQRYYIYGGGFKAAGDGSNLEYVFFQKFKATVVADAPSGDGDTGTIPFAAKNRITDNGDGTFTTAGNAGNQYAMALADLSEVSGIGEAVAVTLEFDVSINGRTLVGIGDKDVRGDNANGSSKSTYNADGLIMRYGTKDGTYVRINDGTNNSAAMGVVSHVSFTLDRTNSTYSYTITNKETGDKLFSAKGVATDISNATVVEVYSWVGNQTNTLSSISYTIVSGSATPDPGPGPGPDPVVTAFPGATDKSSSFAQSQNYQLQMGKKATFSFKNYGYGVNPDGVANSWHNWTVGIYTGEVCHAFTRADFWDNIMNATTGYEAMSVDNGQTKTWVDWNKFQEDMKDATVNLTVTYNSNGQLAIHAESKGAKSGNIYYVDRTVEGMTANSVDVRLGIEYSYITNLTSNITSINGDEPGDEGTYYVVNISKNIVNGTITANPATAKAGQTVTLSVSPAKGYALVTLDVLQGTNYIKVTNRQFTMPEGAVTVHATFVPVEEGEGIYNVVVDEFLNGTITASRSKANEGNTVTLTINPADGYALTSLRIVPTTATYDGPEFSVFSRMAKAAIEFAADIAWKQVSETDYTFTMPASDVAVIATFAEKKMAYLTIPTQWITFYAPENYSLPAGVNAYTIASVVAPTADDMGAVILKKQGFIAKEVPMILENTVLGQNLSRFNLAVTVGSQIDAADVCSEFVGVSAPYVIQNGDICFVLRNGQFMRYTGKSIDAHNCYLMFNTPNAARGFRLFIEDETDGISSIASEAAAQGQVYDLQGRRVNSTSQKGVYIVDGKKMMMK